MDSIALDLAPDLDPDWAKILDTEPNFNVFGSTTLGAPCVSKRTIFYRLKGK